MYSTAQVQPHVLFAIDSGENTTASKHFLSSINPLPLTQIIGYYKGTLERGYMCQLDTYKNRIKPSVVKNQECILVVNNDNSCYYAKPDLSKTWHAGRMVETTNPFEQERWTYVEKTGKFFTIE